MPARCLALLLKNDELVLLALQLHYWVFLAFMEVFLSANFAVDHKSLGFFQIFCFVIKLAYNYCRIQKLGDLNFTLWWL